MERQQRGGLVRRYRRRVMHALPLWPGPPPAAEKVADYVGVRSVAAAVEENRGLQHPATA
jgi:hypothetical protein